MDRSTDSDDALPSALELRQAWFTAASSDQQEQVLAQLVLRGNGVGVKRDFQAVSTLIELCHLTRYPASRLPILRALGRCEGSAFAVPVLIAELADPSPIVVTAALHALGRIGLPFGARAVLRWYERPSSGARPFETTSAAMRAMATIGLPETPSRVEAAWRAGHLRTVDAHLALAEVASDALRDEAVAHLARPALAQAAALHLASIRDPELPALLQPMLEGADPVLALLASRLLDRAELSPRELLEQAMASSNDHHARRLARSLRATDPHERLVALKDLWDEAEADDQQDCLPELVDAGHGPSAAERRFRGLIKAALRAGLPELQDAVLDRVALKPTTLIRAALLRVHTDTPSLQGHCERWIGDDRDEIATDAIRAVVNTRGQGGIPLLRGMNLAGSVREVHRLEWVRALQNAFRNDRDARGNCTLAQGDRKQLADALRPHLTASEPRIAELAHYTAGNVGLTELASTMVGTIGGATSESLRRAAATSLGELQPRKRCLALAAALATEESPMVVFRLLRALVRAKRIPVDQREKVAQATRTRMDDLQDDARVLALELLGGCGDARDVPMLVMAAGNISHAAGCAAIDALGRLGLDGGLPALLEASRAADPERRRRAAAALAAFPTATPRLIELVTDPDEVHDVRQAAATSLEGHHLGADHALHLAPRDLDDPLAVTLLLLCKRCAGAAADPAAIDARLAAEVPGLELERLLIEHPDVVRAFRTAEFFHLPAVKLPGGLDASPPVLFWVKGLEVWLKRLLNPALEGLLARDAGSDLHGITRAWRERRSRVAPAWCDDLLPWNTHDLWGGLGSALDAAQRAMDAGWSGGRSIRVFAAALLATADVTEGPWAVGLSRDARVSLANGLAALNHERNQLTHGHAGDGRQNEAVRRLALTCVDWVARMRVGR